MQSHFDLASSWCVVMIELLCVVMIYALPCGPEERWHGNEIPAGYARVAVDDIERGYERLELDYATPEGEKTLQQVGSGIVL